MVAKALLNINTLIRSQRSDKSSARPSSRRPVNAFANPSNRRRACQSIGAAIFVLGFSQPLKASDPGYAYSIYWPTLGWQSTAQAACDAGAAVFDANNGNYSPSPNHQFIASHTLRDEGYCAVKYYLDNDSVPGSLYDWGYTIAKQAVVDIYRTGAPPRSCPTGNPIYPAQGTKSETIASGLSIGRLSLGFTYDTTGNAPLASGGQRPVIPKPPVLGALWDSTLHRRLVVQVNGRGALVSRGDGHVISFVGNGAGAYTAEGDGNDRLLSVAGGYRYVDAAARRQEDFNSAGDLTGIAWAGGDSVNLGYSTSSTPSAIAPAAGYLIHAQDNRGRTIDFAYQLPAGATPATDGRLVTVTDSAGQAIAAAYDSAGNLSSLTWADGRAKTFLYELTALPWALTGVIDELSSRYSTFSYDPEGRAISTEHAGAVDRFSTSYASPPQVVVTNTVDSATQTVYRYHDWALPTGTMVSNPQGSNAALGTVTIYGKTYVTSRSQPAGSGCAASTSAATFDANGNKASEDDFNGSRACFVSDLSRNLEATRVEGLSNTTACSSVTAANATLPIGSRKTSTQWHPDWRMETKRSESGKLTTLVYNGQPDPFNSNVVALCTPGTALLPDSKPIAVLCKQVEQATTDGNGSRGTDVTGTPAIPADPSYANNVLLLHMDDSTGGVFTDASSGGKVPSNVVSPVATDTTSAKYGSAAGNFTGGYLWYADAPDFDMAAGDFTIETWVKFNTAATGSRVFLFGKGGADGGANTITVGKDSSNRLWVPWTTTAGSSSVTDTVAVSPDTWYHVAVVRSAGTLTLWKNGVNAGSAAISGSFIANTNHFGVGVFGEYTAAYGGAYGTKMMGWLDEFRITKGVARYTSAFTPPSVMFGSATSVPAVPSAIDTAVPNRVSSWTYNAFGQVLTAKGPRTDVNDTTTYAYYADTTVDHTLGDLQSMTNAAGKVSTYDKYNKVGQVLQSTDPNGVVTVNTYDLRQRLLSATVGTEATSYTYDPVGQLITTTLPNGATITNTYDAAHRLIQVADAAGNKVIYTLDASGNRIVEQVKDAGGTLVRNITRSYDALNRLQSSTGAAR